MIPKEFKKLYVYRNRFIYNPDGEGWKVLNVLTNSIDSRVFPTLSACKEAIDFMCEPSYSRYKNN